MGDLETKIPDDDKFRDFVTDLLKNHSGLNDETIDILTDPTGLPLFQKAFTSKTFSTLNNYEQLEFIGDTIVNDAVSLFIFNKYPDYTVEWLTYIKHSIISSLGLSTVATELNFWSHIRYKLEGKLNEKEKLLEDVLEAFVGALRQVIDSKASELCGGDPPFGLGTLLTHKFIFSVLEKMVERDPDFVSDSWEKVKDPKTRIKQMMSKHGFGDIKQHLTTQFYTGRGWEAKLYLKNKIVMSGLQLSKKAAEQDVSKQGIALFKKNNLEEKIPPQTIAPPPPSSSFQSSAPSPDPAPSLQPAEASSFQPASPPPSPPLQAAARPHTPPLYAAPPPSPPLSLEAEGFRPPPFQIFHQRPQFVRRLPPPRRISMQSFQNRLPSADPQFNFHQRPQFVRRLRQFQTSHLPARHRPYRW